MKLKLNSRLNSFSKPLYGNGDALAFVDYKYAAQTTADRNMRPGPGFKQPWGVSANRAAFTGQFVKEERNRDNEIGDAKHAPGIGRSPSACRLPRQQYCNHDCSGAGYDVPSPRGQRELPGHMPAGPKHEKDAACNTIDLSRHKPG